MQFRAMHTTRAAMLLVTVALSGCPDAPPPTDSGTPTLPPAAVTTTLPNTSAPGCTTLIRQTLTATVGISFEPTGIFNTVGVSVTGGTFSFSIQPMLPVACTAPAPLPAVGPVTVTIALDYFGERTTTSPLCMNASQITITNFAVSGIAALDGVLRDIVTANIHQAMDDAVADRLNRAFNGGPLPAGSASRCTIWIDLGAP